MSNSLIKINQLDITQIAQSQALSATYANTAGSANNSHMLDNRHGTQYLYNPNNLPIYNIGSLDFLDLDIASSFNGTGVPFMTRGFISYDAVYNKAYMLRTATNGVYTGIYYSYFNNDLVSSNDLTYTSTDIEYRPDWLLESEHIDVIISSNPYGFCCRVITNNDYTLPIKYYWVNINDSMDPERHTYVDVTSIVTHYSYATSCYNYSIFYKSKSYIQLRFALVYCPEKDVYFLMDYIPWGNTSKADMEAHNRYTYFAVYNNDEALSVKLPAQAVFPKLYTFFTDAQFTAGIVPYTDNMSSPTITYSVSGDDVIISHFIGTTIYMPTTSTAEFGIIDKFKYNASSNSVTETNMTGLSNISNVPEDYYLSSRGLDPKYTNGYMYSRQYSFHKIPNKTIKLEWALSLPGYIITLYPNETYEVAQANAFRMLSDNSTPTFTYNNYPVGVVYANDSSIIGKNVYNTIVCREGDKDYLFCHGSSKTGVSTITHYNAVVEGFDSESVTASSWPNTISNWTPTSIDSIPSLPNVNMTYETTASPRYITRSGYTTHHIYDSIANLKADIKTKTISDANMYTNIRTLLQSASLSADVVFSNIPSGTYYITTTQTAPYRFNFYSHYVDTIDDYDYFGVVYGIGHDFYKTKVGFLMVKAPTGSPATVSYVAGTSIPAVCELQSMAVTGSYTRSIWYSTSQLWGSISDPLGHKDVYGDLTNFGVYKSSNNVYYISFSSCYMPTRGGGIYTQSSVTVSAGTFETNILKFAHPKLLNKGTTYTYNTPAWYCTKLTLHPHFGLGWSDSFTAGYLTNDIYWYNNLHISDIEQRLIRSFSGSGSWLYGGAGGIPGGYIGTLSYDLSSLKSSIGFQVSHGDIEIFIKGKYFVLTSNTITGTSDGIAFQPNSTYYFYVRATQDIYVSETLYADTADMINFGWATTDDIGVSDSYFGKKFNFNNKIKSWQLDTTDINDVGEIIPKYFGGRNIVINGNFDVWQRGSGLSNAELVAGTGAHKFAADRWAHTSQTTTDTPAAGLMTGSITAMTFTPGQTDVTDFPTKYIRDTRIFTSLITSYTNVNTYQYFEDLQAIYKPLTISFWIRGSIDGHVKACFGYYYSAYDELGVLRSYNKPVGNEVHDIYLQANVWRKVTITKSVVPNEGETVRSFNFGIYKYHGDNGTSDYDIACSYSGTLDLAHVQLEEGYIATKFEQRPLPLEQLLCQRYFERLQVYCHPSQVVYAPSSPTAPILDPFVRVYQGFKMGTKRTKLLATTINSAIWCSSNADTPTVREIDPTYSYYPINISFDYDNEETVSTGIISWVQLLNVSGSYPGMSSISDLPVISGHTGEAYMWNSYVIVDVNIDGELG